MNLKTVLILCAVIAVAGWFSAAVAQPIGIRKHLGYDFSNNADEITRYYKKLGAKVVREDVFSEIIDNLNRTVEVRRVQFDHTPRFLSVETSGVNIGLVDGKIQVISILTNDLRRVDRMDYLLHKYSHGKVDVEVRGGSKAILWKFDDCSIVKETVVSRADTERYYKYDILPIAEIN